MNETFARRYVTGDGDLNKALGRIIRLRDAAPIQIVGVAKDSTYGSIGTPPPPVFYLPYLQQGGPNATLHVRTEGDPAIVYRQFARKWPHWMRKSLRSQC